ncbi:MAG: ATP-binding domain-containing protein [Kofleriaceae bacterium]
MSNQVTSNSPGAKIIAEEEKLFAQIQARVTAGGEDDRPTVDGTDLDRDLLSLRDQIAEARGEDLPPLVEQMTRLAALRSRLGGGKSLPIDLASPYFAHMRLRAGGRSRDVMVGKRGFIDRGSNVQIVDWRNAPVSRIYYRYEEGDDYEEEIAGKTVDGVVEARRNVSIFKGTLRRIGAPQGTFIKDARGGWVEAVGTLAPVLHGGSGKAARPAAAGAAGKPGRLGVHGGGPVRADKALPEIAALIDKEQFELITQPDSGIVVIQGGAGSGKTTVALHRVAFLNFNDERRFKASACLFVVPSQSLVRYVGGVLPALGVAGVPVITYTSWARGQRLRLLPDSPVKYNDDPPDNVSRVKKHPAMIRLLAHWVARQAAQIAVELAELPELSKPTAAAAVAEWERLRKRALLPRLVGLGSWLKKSATIEGAERLALEGLLRRWRKRGDDIGADWAELLTDAAVLAEGFEGTDVSDRDLAATVAWVRRQVAPPPKPPVDDDGKVYQTADGAPVVDDSEPAGKLDPEDDPILLRLIQLKRGGLLVPGGDETRYQHVAIDEAQDRSALEVKVLIEAVDAPDGDPDKRSVTIAGDVAQRLVFDNNFTGWADLLAQTGQPAIVRPLKLSYRSTAEVMLLAREVLGPELAPDEPLAARPGEPVELHEFSDVGEAVAFLSDALRGLVAREPTASCCVVARHPEQADAYFDGLRRAEVPNLRRIRRDEFNFQPGVDVTDVSQVKGLEFDYVVMVDVNESSYPAANWARHMLHIGVTRAAHQLWLVSTGEPSPLLPSALRDGGRMTVGS